MKTRKFVLRNRRSSKGKSEDQIDWPAQVQAYLTNRYETDYDPKGSEGDVVDAVDVYEECLDILNPIRLSQGLPLVDFPRDEDGDIILLSKDVDLPEDITPKEGYQFLSKSYYDGTAASLLYGVWKRFYGVLKNRRNKSHAASVKWAAHYGIIELVPEKEEVEVVKEQATA